MRVIASYTSSVQVSEDSWARYTEAKSFDETATIQDIWEWMAPKIPAHRKAFRMVGVQLCEEQPGADQSEGGGDE